MRHFFCRYPWLCLLLSTCLLGVWADAQADAQGAYSADVLTADVDAWTLHVGQYHNEKRAQAQVTRLQQLGFDAYLQPSLLGLLRVRVGCFLSPAAASTVASLLQGHVDAAMVLMPLETGAEVRVCTQQHIGFITPDAWGIHDSHARGVVFWIQLAGQTGYVVYHEGWHVSQDEPRLQPLTAQARQPAFVRALLAPADASLRPSDVVRYQLADASKASEEVAPPWHVAESVAEPLARQTRNNDAEVEAESSLAASLARLPARPRVSLHATREIREIKADGTTLAAMDAMSIPQSIIIGNGDILWQNDHEVVVHQQGRLVSLRVVPVSATFLRAARE